MILFVGTGMALWMQCKWEWNGKNQQQQQQKMPVKLKQNFFKLKKLKLGIKCALKVCKYTTDLFAFKLYRYI